MGLSSNNVTYDSSVKKSILRQKLKAQKQLNNSSRIQVSSVNDIKFASNLKKKKSSIPSVVSYMNKSKTTVVRKKANLIVKLGWIICLVLALRLVFMERGVIGFYSKIQLLKAKQAKLDNIKVQNQRIIQEIEKLKVDTKYQKKVVRDNLGVIDADEYLVLFAGESVSKTK